MLGLGLTQIASVKKSPARPSQRALCKVLAIFPDTKTLGQAPWPATPTTATPSSAPLRKAKAKPQKKSYTLGGQSKAGSAAKKTPAQLKKRDDFYAAAEALCHPRKRALPL